MSVVGQEYFISSPFALYVQVAGVQEQACSANCWSNECREKTAFKKNLATVSIDSKQSKKWASYDSNTQTFTTVNAEIEITLSKDALGPVKTHCILHASIYWCVGRSAK